MAPRSARSRRLLIAALIATVAIAAVFAPRVAHRAWLEWHLARIESPDPTTRRASRQALFALSRRELAPVLPRMTAVPIAEIWQEVGRVVASEPALVRLGPLRHVSRVPFPNSVDGEFDVYEADVIESSGSAWAGTVRFQHWMPDGRFEINRLAEMREPDDEVVAILFQERSTKFAAALAPLDGQGATLSLIRARLR